MTTSWYQLRSSPIAGTGAFAVRPIPKGTRIIEYVGERISHAEADSRYDDEEGKPTHVVLFTVDKNTVIDAGVGGNDARFFNHACDPNCEVEVVTRRIFLDALRDIRVGEELTYDYNIEWGDEDDATATRLYPCHCGSANCRGTLLAPRKKKAKKAARKPGKKARR